MAEKSALMMIRLGAPPEREEEWNDWLNNVHIPSRLDNMPGILAVRRFTALEGEPKYLNLWELANADAPTSEGYGKLREKEDLMPPDSFEVITRGIPQFSREVYEQIYPEQGEYQMPDTQFVLVVGHDVPADREEEYNAWYHTEHIPAIMQVPGFVTARRFVAVKSVPAKASSGSPAPKYLSVYDLESKETLQSEAFSKARNTPWSDRVRNCIIPRLRIIGQLIYRKP
ncbi:hypothetical protein ACFLV5_01605 [Chloroflexota bacterium]